MNIMLILLRGFARSAARTEGLSDALAGLATATVIVVLLLLAAFKIFPSGENVPE